jgi:uncharacterized membrane protein
MLTKTDEWRKDVMKRSVFGMFVGILFCCAAAQVFGGEPPRNGLQQLPAEKEMLFHQTMRTVFEATASVRDQIKALETEMKAVLAAEPFDEALFLTKAEALRDLHDTMREAMDTAMAGLAAQFMAAERIILGEMILRGPGPQGPPPPPPGVTK